MEIQTKIVNGITYSLPKVTIMGATDLLIAEYAGRTAYDSFSNSEHECIRNKDISNLDADSSELLTSLAWVHHHHSVLEHLSINYLIEGTSRAVLQEIVRHRIASYTVRSTRYTMSSILNAFVASYCMGALDSDFHDFRDLLHPMDLFVTPEVNYQNIEIHAIFNKLVYQYNILGKEEFLNIAIAKSSLDIIKYPIQHPEMSLSQSIFEALEAGKKKRNVGDAFKHIVTDNWKVDMVVTFNLRALKNYFTLRDSGSAYFQIQWLSAEMIKATPRKYLDLIIKSK